MSVDEEPNFVSVTDLESSTTFSTVVLPSMLNSESGSATATIEQVVSRGNAGQDGSEKRNIEVTYFWAPLVGTDFFLAIVVPTSRLTEGLYSAPLDTSSVYHRIDL